MININNIHSLTDFTRNAREHIDRLKETGQAEGEEENRQAQDGKETGQEKRDQEIDLALPFHSFEIGIPNYYPIQIDLEEL